MSNVDKRVVQMEFDNKQFEKDMQTTIKSLQSFEKNINNVGKNSSAFDGISKGLENVKHNVKGFSLDAVSSAFDKVKVSISGWEMAAMAAISNVVTGAMNAAKNMAKALVSDPVKEGFAEYELKMNSIQTMMLGSGSSLDQVNKKLEELNQYADRTIYSFSDMTQNIGKFINAGVGLDDAVSAIQGVSNVAAISGANANEASRAMYNFAQALSSGSIRLIDWKSIENANMATVQFKQELLDTALALGTVVKVGDDYQSTTKDLNGRVSEAFNSTKKFNDSLSAQWMTSEVLIETLKRYTDETTELGQKAYAAAQDVKTFHQLMDTLKEAVGSGWAQTWELIFGNFEEAKVLWTSISNVVGGFINRQTEARNEMLKNWAAAGGRAALFENLKNIFNDLASVIAPIRDAFREIFGSFSAGKLLAFNRTLYSLSLTLQPTIEELVEIRDVFKSLFQAIKSATEPLKRAWKEAFPDGTLFSLVRNFMSLIGNIIKTLTDSFNALTDNGEVIHNIAFTIFSVLRTGINVLTLLFSIIKSIIKITSPIATFLGKLIGYIANIITEIGSLIFKSNAIRQSIVKITNSINKLVDPLQNVLLYVFSLLLPYLNQFKEWALSGARWLGGALSKGIENLANGLDGLVDKIKNLTNRFYLSKDGTEAAKNKLTEYKDKVTETSNAVTQAVKKNELLSAICGKVTTFFSNLWSHISGFFTGLWSKIQPYVQTGVSKIQEIFSTAFASIRQNGLFGAAGNGIGSILGNIGKGLSTMIESLVPMKDKLLEFFGEDSVISLIKDFVKVILGLKAGKMFDFFSDLGDSVKAVGNAIDGISKSLQNLIKTYSKGDPSKAFRNFAIGIGIIVASLLMLSQIEPGKLWMSVGVLATIISIITGILVSMDKVLKSDAHIAKNAAAFSLFFMAVASSISKIIITFTILLAAVNAIKNPDSIKGAIKIVLGIISLVGLFATFFAVLTKSSSGMAPQKIAALALVIKVLGSTIKSISIVIAILSLFDSNKVKNAAAIVSGITILLGLFVMLFARFTKSSSGMAPQKIAALALVIKVLGSTIKSIAIVIGILSLFDSEKLLKSWFVVSSLTTLFTLLIGLLSITADPKRLVGAAKSMLILSGAVAIIALVVRKLAKSDLKSTLAAIILLIGSFTILSGILIGLSVFSAPILALSAAFLTFGAATLVFGAGVYLIISAVEKLTKLGPNGIKIMTDAMTSIIANIPKWIALLIKGVLEHLTKVIPAIVQHVIKIIVSIIEGVTSGIGAIVTAIGNLFKAIVTTLSQYSNAFKIEDLFWAVQSIALIAGLIFVLQILASDMGSAVKGIALMATVLTLLVGALLVINQFTNPRQSIDILKGIAETLLSLTGVFAVVAAAAVAFSTLKVPFTAIFKVIGAIALFILAMVALVGLIGGVVNWLEKSFEWDIVAVFQKGAQIMSLTGEALGGFMGAIVGTFAKSINGTNIATLLALVPLILALEPLIAVFPILTIFVGVVGAVASAIDSLLGDGSTLYAMKKATEIMGEVGKALGEFLGGFVNGVMKQFSEGLMNSLITFADGLSEFMLHIAPFLTALNMINGSMLEKTGQLTLIILEMCAAELISGITGFFKMFTGGSSLEKFAIELEQMGPHLVNFSKDLVRGHFNAYMATKAAKVAAIMANVANNLPKEDGWWQSIVGKNMSMNQFGAQLSGLGASLVAFASSISELTEEDTKRMSGASDALSILVDIANKMPKTGGWLQSLLGTNTSIDTFGTQLKTLGSGLTAFVAEVYKISQGNFVAANDRALPILTALVDVSKKMPTGDGGLLGAIFGTGMDIATFGSQLASLGEGISGFAANTADISEGNVTTSNRAIEIALKLVDLSKKLSEQTSGGLFSIFTGTSDEDLESFAQKLPVLGEGLSGFAEAAAQIKNVEDISVLSGAIESLAKAFSETKTVGDFSANFLDHVGRLVNGWGDDYRGLETFQKIPYLLMSPSGFKGSKFVTVCDYISQAITKLAAGMEKTNSIGNFSTNFLQYLADFIEGENTGDYKGIETFRKIINIFSEDDAKVFENITKSIGICIGNLSEGFKKIENPGDVTTNFLQYVGDLIEGESSKGYKGVETFKQLPGLLGEYPGTFVSRMRQLGISIQHIATAFKDTNGAGNVNYDFLQNVGAFVNGKDDYSPGDLLKFSYLLGENPANIENAKTRIESVKNVLIDLANMFNTFSGENGSGTKDFVNAVNALSTLPLTTLHDELVNGSRVKAVLDAANELCYQLGSAFLNKQKPLKDNVLTFLSAFDQAFTDYTKTASTAIADFVSKCVNQITSFAGYNTHPINLNSFYGAGYYSVKGYIDGIRSRLADVQQAGRQMGQNALDGANKAVDNRSPSHKFEDYVAYYSVLGFVRGFQKRGDMAFEAGSEFASNALNGTSSIIARISDVINSDMDLRPVISPVLDLSEISANSGRINGMLSTRASLSMANSASNLIEQGRNLRFEAAINQNGSPDVVSAINDLTTRMDSMESAILNRPIYMDKVKVSKEITPEIDKNLGRNAYYSRRG